MLDVLMTVLTFFIIVSMTLSVEQGVEMQLPGQTQATPVQTAPEPLIVTVSRQRLTIANQPVTKAQAMQQIQTYLNQNLKGSVVLQPTPEMPYEQVVTLLGELKTVGRDRVLLAVE
jgi:biopolymer transport protein ExbD